MIGLTFGRVNGSGPSSMNFARLGLLRALRSTDERLDGIEDARLELGALERVHLLHPRRAGDVDLGQPPPDHVDADEEQPVPPQRRGEALDDPAVVVVQTGARRPPADVEVRADLALGRNAQQRAERLPVEQQDALVAAADLRQVALRHGPALSETRRLLEDREQVPVVVPDVEDPLAPAPVEGLDDHLAPALGQEVDQLGDPVRDDRLRHQLREVQGVELLVGGEDALRRG